MKKRGLISLLALTMAFNAVTMPAMAQRRRPEPPPKPDRYASILMEEESGRVLYERGADHQLHPASTTKLMTAYLTFKALKDGTLKLDQQIKVSDWAASQPATNLGMKPNGVQTVTKIKVEDNLRGMLCHSANDAAVVFAEAIGGSQEEFVKKMNAEAQRLGMTHTHFANPNGLPDATNKTTVEDMAKLARALIEDFPEDYKYFSIRNFTFNGHTFRNTNHLLGVYPGLDGMKTGWIATSGFNLVASAKHGDMRFIAVVFGANTAETRNEDVKKLMNYGIRKEQDPKVKFAYGPLAARNRPERYVEVPQKPQPIIVAAPPPKVPDVTPPALAPLKIETPPPALVIVPPVLPTLEPPATTIAPPKDTTSQPGSIVQAPEKGPTARMGRRSPA